MRIREEVGSDLRVLMIEVDGFNNRLCSLSEEKREKYPAVMAEHENMDALVQKAARRTDNKIFGPQDGVTTCRTAFARASDVPCGSDPLRIIHVAQERLRLS